MNIFWLRILVGYEMDLASRTFIKLALGGRVDIKMLTKRAEIKTL